MRLLIYLILIFGYPLICQAQSPESIVSSIEISGEHKLDKDFLLGRITTKINENTSWDKLLYDKLRLNRLNGVQYVIIELDTLADASLNVRIEVIGQKTIKPFSGLGIVKGNFWYQIGAAEFNFARKNQTLLGYFQSQDGRPNGKLLYNNPYFKGKQWGFSIDAFHNGSIEPLSFNNVSATYRYNLTGIGLGGVNHFGFSDKITYNLTYFTEKYEREPGGDQFDGPAFLFQEKILVSLGYIHDKVLYDFFYRTGIQHQLLLQSVSTIGDDIQFLSVSYEGRAYWKLTPTTNLASQLRISLGTNNNTPFAPYVLDSNFNLRGVGNRVDRATAQVVINLEVRETVFEYKDFAIQAVLFSDSGSWRSPGAEFDILFQQSNFRSFVGGGARLILTKVFDSVLRLDYGIDVFDSNTHGFVFGFGQFF